MKRIFIFSVAFPYGKHEPFLKDEILFHEKSVLISSYIGDVSSVEYNLPAEADINVWHSSSVFFAGNKIAMSISALLSVFSPYFWRELFSESIRPINRRKIVQLLSCISKARQIVKFVEQKVKEEKELLSGDEIVFYAYWMNQLALAAVMLAKKYKGISISRCHGYDLYKRIENNDYVTCQKVLTKELDYIFPISEDGKEILEALFPNRTDIKSKIKVSRLGTMDYGISKAKENIQYFTIVSCSNVVPLKRVEMIFDIIKSIEEFAIKWIHFGDGPLLERLKERVSGEETIHIIQLMGYTQKKDEMDFYLNNYIHLFINVSETEGIPVSIMEALSFGIPCVGTNVGGTHEIIENGNNGWLLDKECSVEDVKKVICMVQAMDKNDYKLIRRRARKYWEDKYSASKNYKDFQSLIGEVHDEL